MTPSALDPIYHQLWPALLQILQEFPQLEKLMESVTRLLVKFSKILPNTCLENVQQLIEAMLLNFLKKPFSCFIFAFEMNLKEYVRYPDLAHIFLKGYDTLTQKCIEILSSKNQIEENPLIASDFFALSRKFMSANKPLFFQTQHLPQTLNILSLSIGVEHQDVVIEQVNLLIAFLRHFRDTFRQLLGINNLKQVQNMTYDQLVQIQLHKGLVYLNDKGQITSTDPYSTDPLTPQDLSLLQALTSPAGLGESLFEQYFSALLDAPNSADLAEEYIDAIHEFIITFCDLEGSGLAGLLKAEGLESNGKAAMSKAVERRSFVPAAHSFISLKNYLACHDPPDLSLSYLCSCLGRTPVSVYTEEAKVNLVVKVAGECSRVGVGAGMNSKIINSK